MFNTILLQVNTFSDHVQYDQKASVPFYVFLVVAIFLIYIKLNKPKYFGLLFENSLKDSEKLDSSSQITFGNLSGVLLQISFILLVSLAIWQTPYFFEKKSWMNYAIILGGVSVLYCIQAIGIFLFSFIIKAGNNHFPTHRLSQNEGIAIILLIGLLLTIYIPFETNWLVVAIITGCFLFNLIRVSIYLTTNISTFHIILYLCTLEIIPVLFLLKLFI